MTAALTRLDKYKFCRELANAGAMFRSVLNLDRGCCVGCGTSILMMRLRVSATTIEYPVDRESNAVHR